MSEPKLISPLLDNFVMGDPISDRNGIRCCPAINEATEGKYIVKIISVPASQSQLDALLLTGAYSDKESALSYFETLADEISKEVKILQDLSQLEGFTPYEDLQIVPMESETGFDIYLLGTYKQTLKSFFKHYPMTQLGAINLGLDICSALSVARRSGYLYVDLKPENIYIPAENEYRIGDIGFLSLSTLKYVSLPDRYRSQYTAPEIQDAFSSLNTTVDIYALGLILYQAFNDGVLPFRNEAAPTEAFPPPAYADYEMAEIILKACAPDPADRWQDPVEMGHALVGYMQRNGANDTPITPVVVETQPQDETESVEVAAEEEITEEAAADTENTAEESDDNTIYIEDSEGNMTFISNSLFEDADTVADEEEIDYEEVSSEVSDMLEQADDLIAHQAPEPVIPPEPIDVPIPDSLPAEPEAEEESEAEDEMADNEDESTGENSGENTVNEEEQPDSDGTSEESDISEDEESEESEVKKSFGWLRATILSVMAVLVVALGFLYYKNYYLQPIESIRLVETKDGYLTVHVDSSIDESKLRVVCSDTYGNQIPAPVINGVATFRNLAPNSAFTVKVEIDGFHRLTGDTSTQFTTPEQTEIVQFHTVTGAEDGSVILSFTVNGRDTDQWTVKYGTAGEAEQELTFSGHMATISGLTVGSEYSFTLIPKEELRISGTDTIKHKASKIVKAEYLYITGCINNTLTTMWSAPADTKIESWTVRCYNENGYDETIVVTETAAEFKNIDLSQNYTVDVTAAGMSVSQRAFAAANSLTVTDFAVDESDPHAIKLSWKPVGDAPKDGWLLMYTIDGSAATEITCNKDNTATLDTKIPGVCYTFTLQTADGVPVLGGTIRYQTAAAESFSGYGVTASSLEFKMCKRPKAKNWDRYDLKKADYTTTFESGQKVSFLVHMLKKFTSSSDKINTLFVIRDANGTVVNASSVASTWKKMWTNKYCELDIPTVPKTPGKYTISVYFNGALANEQSFTVTEK